MYFTRERRKLKKSPGYRLGGMRIMIFSVNAENGKTLKSVVVLHLLSLSMSHMMN